MNSLTKNKQDVIFDSLILTQHTLSNAGKCYCNSCDPTDYDHIPLEGSYISNCIISSLEHENADVSLSLIENYLIGNTMAFGSHSLKAFFAFLLNSPNSLSEKKRVVAILLDQLLLHPSCAVYMSETYECLLLGPEEEHFKNSTVLEYTLQVLANKISPTETAFSATRTSRQTRRRVSYDERKESDLKNHEAQEMDESNNNVLKESSHDKDIAFIVLNMLTEVLIHDFRATMNRGESPVKCLLAKLIFKNEACPLTYQDPVYRIFDVYKACKRSEDRCYLSRLLELAATLCFHVDRAQTEADLLKLGSCSHHFVSDFLINIFDDNDYRESSYSVDMITCIELVWLRYHAAHFALSKVFGKRILNGIKGVVKELSALFKLPKKETSSPSNSQPNGESSSQSNGESSSQPDAEHDSSQDVPNAGIDELIAACLTNDLESLKRLSDTGIDLSAVDSSGRSALHVAAKHGNVDCVSFLLKEGGKRLNLQSKDHEGLTPLMHAERGNHVPICDLLTSFADRMNGAAMRKLTPFVCSMMMVIVDTTIQMMDADEFKEREDTVESLMKLISLMEELSRMNNIPNELKVLSQVLSEIEVIN